MKESKLLEMQNKIKAMTNVLQQLISEITHLRELSVGTLETIKLMLKKEDGGKCRSNKKRKRKWS